MLFNSIHFLFFLPAVIIVYYTIPPRYRWALLLIASYYFYACWKVEFIFLIIASTLTDYLAGLKIEKETSESKRKIWLIFSIVANLCLLFFFKYYNFFSLNVNEVFSHYNIMSSLPSYNIILPVGISFYTFQSLSYTIDVYRKKKIAEKHPGIFALYVSFFPQLVAGPIERSTQLLPQLINLKKVSFSYENLINGSKLICWGFFKKVVIADRIGIYADHVFNNQGPCSGFSYLMASYLFAYQIYCDFSGYSDIAVGSARIFGVKLMNNFNRPYFAGSISDFWKRWHISLSTWFRDYLYIPLGGNRVSQTKLYMNILITFLLSGLWHGANWTFILWGGIHGVLLLGEKFIHKVKEKIPIKINHNYLLRCVNLIFMFHIICFTWIIFRAHNISEVFAIIKSISGISGFQLDYSNIFTSYDLKISIIFILLLELTDKLRTSDSFIARFNKLPFTVRMMPYIILLLILFQFGMFHHPAEFIYFQF